MPQSNSNWTFLERVNVSITFQYQGAVTERLNSTAPTSAARDRALAVLWQIIWHLGWRAYECNKTAVDLINVMGYGKALMARTIDLLEQVGEIHRMKRGRVKIITVTPEGAFRGNVNTHAKIVEKYKLDVIDESKGDD